MYLFFVYTCNEIKEFISDIVILVEDESPEIKRHARFFFNELNKKSKNVYSRGVL